MDITSRTFCIHRHLILSVLDRASVNKVLLQTVQEGQDPIYIVTNIIKRAKTSWTANTLYTFTKQFW